MKRILLFILAIIILLLTYTSLNYSTLPYQFNKLLRKEIIVAIQPYQGIDQLSVKEVKQAIENYYGFKVEVLPYIKLPEKSRTTNIAQLKYYNPSPNRFRADTLIRDLRSNLANKYSYVIGLTASDISTTKKRMGKIKEPTWMYTDWGIFGLGFRPGKSCIVSTFRLGRDTYDQSKIRTRLRKIVCHELGHNLGLPHCPNPDCFMRDALESMSTIDYAKESLCPECKKKIGHKVKKKNF